MPADVYCRDSNMQLQSKRTMQAKRPARGYDQHGNMAVGKAGLSPSASKKAVREKGCMRQEQRTSNRFSRYSSSSEALGSLRHHILRSVGQGCQQVPATAMKDGADHRAIMGTNFVFDGLPIYLFL